MGLYFRFSKLGQKEVADVIYSKLRLESVLGLSFGSIHNACVVDQSM